MQPEGLQHEGLPVPQSLARLGVHLVFSTKGREPLIVPEAQPGLFAYLAGTLNALGCPALEVGGVADHVHLLFLLSRTITPADTIEEVKKESSKWAKENVHPRFYWQGGYGIFAVSASNEPAVAEYIRKQERRHQKMSFQDEVRVLMQKHGTPLDERYFWD